MNAPQTPYERFMATVAVHAHQRADGASWPLYESLKRQFVETVPGASSEQYTAAMRAIAKAAGV